MPPGAGAGAGPPSLPPSPPPPQFPPGPPLAPPASPVPPGAIRAAGLWASPPPEGPPPRRPTPTWVVATAVLVVLALLGGIVAGVVRAADDDDTATDATGAPFDRDDGPATPETAPPSSPPGTGDLGDEQTPSPPPTTGEPLTPDDFDAVVQSIEDFVAAERGLPWLRDVTVELADDAEFEARLLEDFDEDAAELDVTGRVLQAFGLVEPGTDLVAAFRELLGVGVVGFYDAGTDELVVRGTTATPYVRTVIAHELTHALDDQHFELERPALDDAADESGFGFTALVEGNAVRIEEAYRATFTPEEEDAAVAEEQALGAGADLEGIPLVLFEQISVPYLLGPGLVDDILESRGQAGLDASFGTPPATSEALLDPAAYITGQPTVAVPAPTADGEEIERHVLGAFGLAQVLGEASFILGGIGSVDDAILGWGGDQYVAWDDGERTCVRLNIVGDTPEDTAEIADAIDFWADDPTLDLEITLLVGDIVTLTSCG